MPWRWPAGGGHRGRAARRLARGGLAGHVRPVRPAGTGQAAAGRGGGCPPGAGRPGRRHHLGIAQPRRGSHRWRAGLGSTSRVSSFRRIAEMLASTRRWSVRRTQRAARRPAGRGAGRNPPHPLVALVQRLVVAQAGLAAAIGLLLQPPPPAVDPDHADAGGGPVRGSSSWCAPAPRPGGCSRSPPSPHSSCSACCGSPPRVTSAARCSASSRSGTLLHPAVARSFSYAPRRGSRRIGEAALAETADGALGGRAAG